MSHMENTFPHDDYAAAVAAAHAARRGGDLDTAAKIYEFIPSAFPQKKHAITVAVDGLKACGKWATAIGVLEAAVKQWPKSALHLSALAEIYRAIGQPARAAVYIQRYLDHDDRNPEAWLHLAGLHDLAGNHAAAEQAYAGALDRDPMNTLAAVGRGDALFQMGRLEDAITCYRRAVTTAPRDANALFALGSALMAQGAEADGHGYLRRSLEIEPRNARAHVNLALTYLNTGSAKEAVAAARNALLVDDQLQIAHVVLGKALAEQGDLEGAAAALSTAAASGTHNDEALFAVASVQTELGNKTSAELALQRILAMTPTNGEARHLLAALHGAPIMAPEENYSQSAFDRIAPQFNNQEIRLHGYRVPAEIAELIEEFEPERRSIFRLADAGCGTGLVAASLKDAFGVEQAVGIDVSPKMAKIAGTAALHDEIIVDDITGALATLDGTFDVIAAGDLFPYLGDLAPFMRAARARLAPGGLLAYSIELSDGEPLKLAPNGRFLHTPAYVEDVARAAGLRHAASRSITLRRLFGKDIPGYIGLLQA